MRPAAVAEILILARTAVSPNPVHRGHVKRCAVRTNVCPAVKERSAAGMILNRLITAPWIKSIAVMATIMIAVGMIGMMIAAWTGAVMTIAAEAAMVMIATVAMIVTVAAAVLTARTILNLTTAVKKRAQMHHIQSDGL